MVQETSKLIFMFACMAKIAYKKSLLDTNKTILALQKKKING
jgi:hypothetical protein